VVKAAAMARQMVVVATARQMAAVMGRQMVVATARQMAAVMGRQMAVATMAMTLRRLMVLPHD